jgi:hypothetical protein
MGGAFTGFIANKYRGTILDYPFVILSHIAKVSSLVRYDSGMVCLPQQSCYSLKCLKKLIYITILLSNRLLRLIKECMSDEE